ncbi:hypothetical protein JTB14_025847 [Gonioctena quinquepunctata]|nr:hypothetical protein JTB14_025847 [Gonioctena quinquepunctata]
MGEETGDHRFPSIKKLKVEHEAAMLKSGSDEETVESSKALSIKKNRISLSGAARKRFNYLIKQGLPAEEARVK